jgi:phosphohistidine phosphatase
MARSIELYLVRHAIAEERGPAWPDDAKRPLTAKGMDRFREVVRGLRAAEFEVDVILTSPLVRARQTADLLASGLESKPAVQLAEALSPGVTPKALAIELARARRARIACVGHEPDLGALAAHLVGASRRFEFKKGGICRIDLDGPAGPGRLVWFATPGLLRARA